MLFVKCCVYILTLHAPALFSGTISLLDGTSEIKKTCTCFYAMQLKELSVSL